MSILAMFMVTWIEDKQIMLTNLLSPPLVSSLVLMINSWKIRHNDRDGEGNDQHSRKRTDTTNNFAKHCVWNHVSIPEITSNFKIRTTYETADHQNYKRLVWKQKRPIRACLVPVIKNFYKVYVMELLFIMV